MSSKPSPKKSRILVVSGPTASGKTRIALGLAEHLNGEILSADSRQMYKLMSIGTAQPTPEELRRVPHFFVADRLPDQEFNAAEFGVEGRRIIDKIIARGKLPIVAGGSGLYIQGLIDGFFEGAEPDEGYRKLLYDRIATEGSEVLLAELHRIDPVAASGMLPSNRRRIVRALETHHLTGRPISVLQRERVEISFNAVLVGIAWDRKRLYDRINCRVEEMLASGLIEEVEKLIARGYNPELKALQTVGYKEVFEFLNGRVSYDETVERIKRNTRRYAKRQLTWFRNDERITWFPISDESEFEAVTKKIVDHFLEK
ncbi:MAG TPA: tRNA (adenosine(37)-N6)-dimethylallyltransferase MiaA [Bacteroidota bacterium]|nr:tRNA (adenosine(37)-N6)-dimethylallyltransferase MiaA [Bacteroidota bacterium]